MSRERTKILEMVANGTISPEEAEKLLGRLDPVETTTATVEDEPEAVRENGKTAKLKYLRVVVDGDDKVNIRVPIGLIRTGIKLGTLMPSSASEQLSEHGIDLSHFGGLEGEELIEALRDLQVDVDSGDGDTVRIFCE